MNDLLAKYGSIKSDLKSLRSDLKSEFEKDDDFIELRQCVLDAQEPLHALKKRLGDTIPAIGSIKARIEAKRGELKTLKQAIKDSLVVTDKATGEQLALDIKF